MKIFFVGDLNGYSRSSQRKRAMENLGHDVVGISTVPLGRLPGISNKPSLVERILSKMRLPLDKTGVNQAMLKNIQQTPFDVIWIEKGLTVHPRTLKAVKTVINSVKLISYTEDDMYRKSNQSRYYLKGLDLYDIIFTTKSYNANPDELASLGARKVVFVDKAYDRDFHRPVDLSEEDQSNFGAEVGFIGTFEAERAQLIFYLAKNGIEVRVFGNGWGGWTNKHPNLKIENRPLYGDEYIKGLSATKINLCFLRKLNRDLQTDRTMEIPACGSFMIAERTVEHKRLFLEDKEAVYFDVHNPNELIKKVRFYLKNNMERIKIANAGRERCLNNGYSHHDRLQFMLAH